MPVESPIQNAVRNPANSARAEHALDAEMQVMAKPFLMAALANKARELMES